MTRKTKSMGSSSRIEVPDRWKAPDSRRPPGVILWGVLALLAGYFAIFFTAPLPSLFGDSRWLRLREVTLLPEEYVQYWFQTTSRAFPLDRLPLLVAASGILIGAWALGCVLLGLLRMDRGLNRLERFVFSCGVGLNATSLYVLALGLAGRLNDRRAFLIPGGAFVLAAIWRLWRSSRVVAPQAEFRETTGEEDDWLDRRWLWLMAPFLLAIFLGGMLPSVEFDAREYHLQAPKEFYLAGRIEFLPHNVYGNMAMGSEMFTLLSMVLMGDWWYGALAGKTVIAAFAPLTVLALFAAGRRFFTPTIGCIAAIIYISTPWIAHVSTTGLVEGVSAFYLLLALYAVMLWRRQTAISQPGAQPPSEDRQNASPSPSPGLGTLALAGFLAGAAVASKYPAAVFVALPLTVWIGVSGRRRGWKAAGAFLLAVFAGCGLWFAKNWALAGNPVYPLLYEWLGGATRTAAKDAQWTRVHYPQGFGLDRLAGDLAAVFWRSEWLSPLLMPLAALSLFVPKYRRAVLALWAFFAFVLAAWWLLTHRIDRFLAPALPVVALLAGIGATWAATRAWRRVVLGLLACGAALNLLFVVTPHPGFDTAYFGSLARLRYTRLADPWHHYLNVNVPPGWKLLTVGDAEVFDVEPPVIYNTVFDDSEFEAICQRRTPEEVRAELLARRVSHIYVHWGEIRRYRQPGNYGFPESIDHARFERLVAQGVLEPPLVSFGHQGEVYPVSGAAKEATGDQPANDATDKSS